MPLIEISWRDHIALQAVTGIVMRPNIQGAKDAAKKAYRVADAMLLEAGKRDLEMDALRERAERAERTLEVIYAAQAEIEKSTSRRRRRAK